MRSLQFKLAACGLAGILVANALGETNVFHATTNSRWDNDANWSLTRVPIDTDDVVIPETEHCDIYSAAVAQTVEIEATAELVITDGYTLTLTGPSAVGPVTVMILDGELFIGTESGGETALLLDAVGGGAILAGGGTITCMGGPAIIDEAPNASQHLSIGQYLTIEAWSDLSIACTALTHYGTLRALSAATVTIDNAASEANMSVHGTGWFRVESADATIEFVDAFSAADFSPKLVVEDGLMQFIVGDAGGTLGIHSGQIEISAGRLFFESGASSAAGASITMTGGTLDCIGDLTCVDTAVIIDTAGGMDIDGQFYLSGDDSSLLIDDDGWLAADSFRTDGSGGDMLVTIATDSNVPAAIECEYVSIYATDFQLDSGLVDVLGATGSDASGSLFTINGGTFRIASEYGSSPTTDIHLTGGTLDIRADFTNSGEFNWTGGTIKVADDVTATIE